VENHFALGKKRNWFGGSSNATTQLLDAMHYRGLLRVAGRASGTRVYALPVAVHQSQPLEPPQAMDALVDIIVGSYAPLPERSLRELIGLLRGGAPQWAHLRSAAFSRAKERLAQRTFDGHTWFWPAAETPADFTGAEFTEVRLLAPFDPIVWDRRRFESLFGWTYRFEAYTPAHKRQRGYYAMPLLWRDRVIGWGNLSAKGRQLSAEIGYISGKAPREKRFHQQLEAELARFTAFLEKRSPGDPPR
jgi:hypothetical protein